MHDITQIDFKRDFTTIREGSPALIPKQKVFFIQDGIDYDATGKACDAKQVKKYFADTAKEAQDIADEAKAAHAEAQAKVDEMMKKAGIK